MLVSAQLVKEYVKSEQDPKLSGISDDNVRHKVKPLSPFG